MSGLEVLAAFGLACNVMQVIGFVHEGVQVGKTIYDTGCLDPSLADATDCLAKGLEDLKRSLETTPKPLNRDEQELLDVAMGSLDTATGLKAELDKIAGVASKSKQSAALRGWLRTIMGGKRRIEKLEKAMRSRREVLESRLLLRVCNKSDAILIQQQNDFDELDTILRGFVQACGRGQTSLDKLIRNESTSVKAHIRSETAHLQHSLNTSIVAESGRVQGHVSSRLEELTLRETEKQEHERLLGSLRYETMNERRNQIQSCHQGTFQWIFHSRKDDDREFASRESQDGGEV
ncbi:hypothetical protein HRG_008201 [Hirsutella rhossiliensis]|uniref:Fungal N-terminal domain-containing protein n=1 Tax=Hirsutella rhossiliensis TaxID=111463 RepID=A0A9P8MRS3_9HYPO|nr:uncharacterized protein HRG_08201 [Hirsutella rhossiliensis]KAH0961048.1 hypothetical protein HRG_08201 [Hirsutella rhossiliensis]